MSTALNFCFGKVVLCYPIVKLINLSFSMAYLFVVDEFSTISFTSDKKSLSRYYHVIVLRLVRDLVMLMIRNCAFIWTNYKFGFQNSVDLIPTRVRAVLPSLAMLHCCLALPSKRESPDESLAMFTYFTARYVTHYTTQSCRDHQVMVPWLIVWRRARTLLEINLRREG